MVDPMRYQIAGVSLLIAVILIFYIALASAWHHKPKPVAIEDKSTWRRKAHREWEIVTHLAGMMIFMAMCSAAFNYAP